MDKSLCLKDKIEKIVTEGMNRESIVGANVLVWHKGKELYRGSFGYADREAGKVMKDDTIFKLYSMSKPVMSVAAMIAVEKGLVGLYDPVSKYLPEFADMKVYNADGTVRPAKTEMTVWNLFTMTSGLCYPNIDTPSGLDMCKVFDAAKEKFLKGEQTTTREYCRQIAGVPLDFDPGERWQYGLSADVLGCVVEVASGMSLGEFMKKELFEPLEMKDTAFFVPEEKWERLSQWYIMNEQTGKLDAFDDLHLGVGKYLQPNAFESGGAGLVSTLEDYSHMAQMLVNGGEYKGKRILSKESVELMSKDHLSKEQKVRFDWESVWGHGYGFLMRVLLDPEASNANATPGEFGWDGWTGTYVMMNPKEEFFVLYLIQRVNTGTTSEGLAIKWAGYEEILQ